MPEISTISESTNPWGSVEIPVILLSFTDKVIFSTTLLVVVIELIFFPRISWISASIDVSERLICSPTL